MAPAPKNTKKTPAKKRNTGPTKADLVAALDRANATIESLAARLDNPAPVVAAAPAPVEPEPQQAEATEGEVNTGPYTIRALRFVPVRIDLQDPNSDKKPYRIMLQPRGQRGDTATVPRHLAQTQEFVGSYNAGLFEVITATEAQQAQYPGQGFQQRVVPIERPQDTTIAHVQVQHDTKGRVVQQQNMMPNPAGGELNAHVEHGVMPTIVGVPGSDPQLTAQFQQAQGQALLPAQQYQPTRAAAAAMQQETGRKEMTPDKLVDKGVMPPLPERVVMQPGQGGQINW